MYTNAIDSPEMILSVDLNQVIPNIRMRMPSLTRTEQSIAENFLKPHFLQKSTSIKEVAERLGVSTALIVKVSKKLGFSGFKQLKDALNAQHGSDTYLPSEQLLPDDSCNEIVSKVLQNSISALTEILNFVDANMVSAAADALINAKNIELYAVGGSTIICEDLQHKLLRFGIRANVPKDRHLMLMSASVLDEQDVVLVVSHSGQTVDLMDAVRVAKQSGATIVSITNNYHAELSQLSDCPLFAPASPEPLLGKNGIARLVKLAIIDSLYAVVASKIPERVKDNLDKTTNAVSLLHR
ncbi:transcriptional regulator [Vibrio ishigakensis]|uniref:Transcriptional regulator n=1 Tax=Vibrio ishigakensis TaxID=1481914 RepID=A0A0B8PG27_9VIBR|nr:SIS domain-containing protein [Vibrio ishigakensis]GAM56662.1 transcriptional regulator, rpiR family [Vibrio ishigakensis]GAM65895.1 transcriptional regulator [Vibrio ishigakensis]GAM69779.1 transcriptional regulator [Vibrio sp. JCM 19236]